MKSLDEFVSRGSAIRASAQNPDPLAMSRDVVIQPVRGYSPYQRDAPARIAVGDLYKTRTGTG